MIVSTADGKFYISNSQTTTRTSNGMTYNVIIKSTSLAGSKKQQIEAYKKYIPSDPKEKVKPFFVPLTLSHTGEHILSASAHYRKAPFLSSFPFPVP